MKKLVIALIIIVLLAGIGIGITYAATDFWSGKARITIESTGGSGNLVVTSVVPREGTWDEGTSIWTVSIAPGERATLTVNYQNIGEGPAQVDWYFSNHPSYLYFSMVGDFVTQPGETASVGIDIIVSVDAPAGPVPDITMDLMF